MSTVGIDYGSKMAGTTVIAYLEKASLRFSSSEKKKDADQFITDWISRHKPGAVFLDAPLSLPGVYRFPKRYDNYFYREADRQLSAMSPMFLGGLTARAMKLKAALAQQSVTVIEVYPGGLSRLLALDKKRYKKDKSYLPTATALVMKKMPDIQLPVMPKSWHEFDALLAYLCGYRYTRGIHESYGTEEEGQIIL